MTFRKNADKSMSQFRKNADELMSQVKVNESMYRTIMNGQHRKSSKNGFMLKRAVIPAAAAVLMIASTMYVGAGYMGWKTSLRDLFMEREESALKVPETQQMPEFYGQFLDSELPASTSQISTEEDAQIEETVKLGNYGKMIVDNELFSIELLETACAGRELFLSYILTQKTEQRVHVSISVDTPEKGQWMAGTLDFDSYHEKSNFAGAFGDYYDWDRLPADCSYELAENQQLNVYTQLGKWDYTTGNYVLYVDYTIIEDTPISTEPFSTFVVEDSEQHFLTAPIELVGNEGYGLALTGSIDQQERNVHFDAYDIYVSPLNVYLTLDGTYEGEISSIWGMESSHDIIVGFQDGSSAKTTVLLSGMGYGDGNIDVNMHAPFDVPIDPEAITTVSLDGVVILNR